MRKRKMVWLIFTLPILLLTSRLLASPLPISPLSFSQSRPAGSLSVAGFFDQQHHLGGVELAARMRVSDYMVLGLAGVLYDNRDITDDTGVFGGYSLSALVVPNWMVAPYFGVGVFVGNREDCGSHTYHPSEGDSECPEDSVFAFNPELGLSVTIRDVHIDVFARRYFDSNRGYSYFDVLGMGVGLSFE